ncbi:MAG: CARDB domain-containing protein [Pseudomonadota bacterium]
MPRESQRRFLSTGVLTLILWLAATPAHAAIGDEVFGVVVPSGFFGHFAVDEAAQRFYVDDSSRGIEIYDFSGIFQFRISDGYEVSSFSRGLFLAGPNRLVGFGSIGGAANTLSTWRIEGTPGDEVLVLESSADLSALAPIREFSRAPDGTFWYLSDETLIHLAADLTTVLSSREIFRPFAGIRNSSSPFGDDAVALTVEATTGRPVLYAYGNVPNGDSLAQTVLAYYLDPVDLSVLGRYPLPVPVTTGARDYLAATGGTLYVLDNSADEVFGYELSIAQQPSLTSFEGDFAGTVWRYCQAENGFDFNDNPQAALALDWAGDPGLFELGNPQDGPGGSTQVDFSLEAPADYNATQFQLPYQLSDFRLRQRLPEAPMPAAHIEIVNGQFQSSGAVPVQLGFATSYAPGFGEGSSSSGCFQYGFVRESIAGSRDVGKWTLTQLAPPTPLDLTIDFAEGFPFLGGKSFGVSGFQFSAEAAMAGQGTDKITLSGGGAFEAGIGELAFKASLGATTELLPESVAYDKGLIGFLIGGVLKAEQPLLELFPPLAALSETPLLGRVLKVATETAKAVAEISLTADTSATAAFPQGDSVSDFCIEGKIEVALAQKVGLVIELLDGLAELSVFGGGQNKISFQSVPTQCPSLAFNEWVAQIFLNARYTLFGATATFEKVDSVKFPFPANKAAPVDSQVVSQQWSYTYPGNTRKSASPARPAVVNADALRLSAERLASAKAGKGADASPTTQVQVISNVGQDAQPKAAVAPDGSALLVWIQERGDLPPTQATDIYFSYSGGGGFTAPAPIAMDTRADLNPVVAYHSSGRWLAFWLKVRDANLPASGDPQADALAQSQQLVPYFAVFDPNTGSWSTPSEAPTNNVTGAPATSYLPRIATGPQNEVAILWLTNLEGDIIPYDAEQQTVASSDFVNWAIFDGAGFATSGVLRQGSRTRFVAMDLIGAFTGDELLIGFNEPFGSFQRTFFLYRAGAPFSNFSVFERPPSSSIFGGGDSLRVLALADGGVALASTDTVGVRLRRGDTWNSLDTLSNLYNDSTNPRDPGLVGGLEASQQFRGSFQIGELPSGEIYSVIPEIRAGQPDYVLTLEDGTATPVALEGLFNGGPVLEKSMSVATASNGQVLMFYYQSDLIEDEVDLDLGTGLGEQTFERVQEPTSGRIMLARHQINTDLAVGDVDLLVGLSEAGQEATVTAKVFNKGDRAITDPKVSIFARRLTGAAAKGPQADVPIVENLTALEGTLAAGAEVEVSLTWELPETGLYAAYAIVDPNNEIDEFNELDNTGPDPASFNVVFADSFER